MNKPNEQTESQTDSPSESKSMFQNNKLKWILAPLGGLLALSVVLNLFLIFFYESPTDQAPTKEASTEQVTQEQQQVIDEQASSSNSVVNETHKIDKEESIGGVTWAGIKTLQSKQMNAENYELWLVENQQRRLIDTFTVSVCDNVTWDINENGGVDLRYMTSPCEAFAVNTDIIYDSKGTEQFRLTHNSSAGSFTFKSDRQPDYDVSLVFEGTCEGSFSYPYEEFSFPKVSLKGIKLTNFREENEFNLSKAVEIECGAGYGDVIINPTIKKPTFDSEKIEFTLPNDQKAVISLKSANYAEVSFK